MSTTLNIDVSNLDNGGDKKLKSGPFNLRKEITNFNKRQSEKKKLSQTLTKCAIDTDLGINANNTQKLTYQSNTQIGFPKRNKPTASFDANASTKISQSPSKSKLEPIQPIGNRQFGNEPSIIEKR
jgi:hypothetical protein